MAVRLPISVSLAWPRRRRRRATWTQAAALANSGFESADPEIVVPALLARRLGIWPRVPAGAVVRTLGTAAERIEVVHLPGAIRVSLNRGSLPELICGGIIGATQDEAVLSDQALDGLGVAIESAGRGLWRLRGSRRVFPSEPPQRWLLPAPGGLGAARRRPRGR